MEAAKLVLGWAGPNTGVCRLFPLRAGRQRSEGELVSVPTNYELGVIC
jgi:hypothetical protein